MSSKVDMIEKYLEEIVEFGKQGKTQDEVAEMYGVCRTTVSRLLERHEIKWPKNGARKIAINEYDEICRLYKNKMSALEIAQMYNVNVATIRTILKDSGVSLRQGGSPYADDDALLWKQLYQDGKMIKDIATQCGVAATTISGALKRLGVDIDRFTYHFDEHYFDIIDTQEKAYLLGLLWADGCNVSDNNSVHLSLQESDKCLLEQINAITQNERPLHFNELSKKHPSYQNQYVLVWHSKHFSDTLSCLGMVPKKTLIIEYPSVLTPDLHRHFIRGYMDGDGCISLTTNKKCAQFSLIGTSMLLHTIQDILKDVLNIDVSVKRDFRARDPICCLTCTKKDYSMKLLNWLYKDAIIFMERKYSKYQQFLEANGINNSCLA